MQSTRINKAYGYKAGMLGSYKAWKLKNLQLSGFLASKPQAFYYEQWAISYELYADDFLRLF